MLTNRFECPMDKEYLTIHDVMLVPQHGNLLSRSLAVIKPFIYSAPMDTVTGMEMVEAMLAENQFAVVSRRLQDKDEYERIVQKYADHPHVFFAIGSKDEELLSLLSMSQQYLKDNKKINIAIDIAHGHSELGLRAIERARTFFNIGRIMSGSICTPEGAFDCIRHGATHLRIGVGPGAACTTRIKTGCGVPQLSAVYSIHRFLERSRMRERCILIADGGIKESGDAVKYLAAGADAIMLGNLLSRTMESAGWSEEGIKHYRGQASSSFQKDFLGKDPDCAEGACSDAFFRDPDVTVKRLVKEFEGGLASALSYLGMTSSAGLNPDKVTFIKITAAAYIESLPHGV